MSTQWMDAPPRESERAAETIELEFLRVEQGALSLRRGALDALAAGAALHAVTDELEDVLKSIGRSVDGLLALCRLPS